MPCWIRAWFKKTTGKKIIHKRRHEEEEEMIDFANENYIC
jgi:hypothetical protein